MQSYKNLIEITNFSGKKNHELSKKCKYLQENADIICKNGIIFVSLYAEKCARVDMKSLFLLIALYTISGKQAVPSGDIPAGSSCVYEQTGSRSGQLTSGNELTLTLSGYDALQLQSVTLQMRSNTSAGAGGLQMKIGNSEVWTISDKPFSDAAWNGAYSTEWVSVSHSLGGTVVPDNASITLSITASKNSLYLQSVALEYTDSRAETSAYTVSFVTYSSVRVSPLKESQPGAGVVLPDVQPDDASWRFYGWANSPVDDGDREPAVYVAGTVYHPISDCMLYAVYMQSGEQQSWLPTDDLSAGDYVIALYEPKNGVMWCATGAVEDNGMLATERFSVPAENGWASLPFGKVSASNIYTLAVKHDTLTIRHKATDSAICMSMSTVGKFAKSSSGIAWIIQPSAVESDAMPQFAISGVLGGETYYVSYYLGADGELYFRPIKSESQPHNLLLYAVDEYIPATATYTSYAFGNGLENNYLNSQSAYHVQMGTYMLTIKDGKKYLQINE